MRHGCLWIFGQLLAACLMAVVLFGALGAAVGVVKWSLGILCGSLCK